MTNLIDGRAIAEQIHGETAQRIAALKARGIQAGLAFVRVGEDPASRVYVGMKEKTSERLGIKSITTVLPEATTQTELLALIAKLNAATVKVVATEELKDLIAKQGMDATAGTPEQFGSFLRSQMAMYRRVAKIANATVD